MPEHVQHPHSRRGAHDALLATVAVLAAAAALDHVQLVLRHRRQVTRVAAGRGSDGERRRSRRRAAPEQATLEVSPSRSESVGLGAKKGNAGRNGIAGQNGTGNFS